MQLPLTQRVVDRLKPDPDGGTLLVWDAGAPGSVTGLLVRVYPTGRRSYFFQYAVSSTRRKRSPIGDANAMTLHQARTSALAHRHATTQGRDPVAERSAARTAAQDAADTARDRVLDHLMDAYLTEKARKFKRAPRTIEEQRRSYRRDIAPLFGSREADTITRRELRHFHARMADRPVLANRVLILLRSFFTWAMLEERIPETVNPASGIAPNPETPRDRRITATEAKRLRRAWALEQHRRGAGDASVAVIAFLGLTGWRKREAFGLRWDAVDRTTGDVRLRSTKSGGSDRWLSREALALVLAQPRVVGSPYVFPSPTNPAKSLADPRATWDRLRQRARVDDVTLHDLRRQFTSSALDIGAPYEIRQALIGHKPEGMTAQYSLPDPVVMREWADRVAARLVQRYQFGVHEPPVPDVLPIANARAARTVSALAR